MAIGLGIAGIVRTGGARRSGRWMAVTGLVLGVLGTVALVVGAVAFVRWADVALDVIRLGPLQRLVREAFRSVRRRLARPEPPVLRPQPPVPPSEDDELPPADEELAESAARRGTDVAQLARAKNAFSQLYLRHSRLLRAFLSSRIPRSELDDVEQVVWERIWQRLPDQFHGGVFRAWMHQIARNYLIDFWRKKRPDELPDELDLRDPGSQTPVAIMLKAEEQSTLENCLNRLTEPMASVVRGRLQGEAYEELCVKLSIDNARAQKLLFTAKQLLQTCVSGGKS